MAKPMSVGRGERKVIKCEYDFAVVGRGSGWTSLMQKILVPLLPR